MINNHQNQIADEQLMVEVSRGKLEYLESLFTKYKGPLFNYFLKCTLDPQDSNDLIQSTFSRIIKYRKSFKKDSVFKLWLFQIARNQVKDHFKKMKVTRDHAAGIKEHFYNVLQDMDSDVQERENKLYRSLEKLPPDKREVLVLGKLQGMKYEEIAKIKEVSVNTIKVQVHRAINQLREIYFEEENE